MVMAIFRDEGSENYDLHVPSAVAENADTASASSSVVPLVRSKLKTPVFPQHFERDWLLGLVERCSKKGAATMVIGRAGSGKTSLVSHFVEGRKGTSWYSVDSSDADWKTFQRYFRAALLPNEGSKGVRPAANSETCAELFADLAAALELSGGQWPRLLVLDGLHHLYDCPWFEDFFYYLLTSIPHTSHVILVARSKPTGPVWRMRSKQVLNVIDEKLLAFSVTETVRLFESKGIDEETARSVHKRTFGRASDVAAYLEDAAASSTHDLAA